jgi:hypothetical protein
VLFRSQETLEEAAEEFIKGWGGLTDSKNSFIEGAKWQQERMYSEEVTQLELLIKSQEELKDKGVLTNEGVGYLNGLKTALKQFKKK